MDRPGLSRPTTLRPSAAAVGRLLDNPSLRVHMGDEAAARVRDRFTWDLVAAATVVYARLGVRPQLPEPHAPWAVS